MDIGKRIKTFRLQAAQRLLYAEPCWADTACADFKYDVQLFLIKLTNMDLRSVSPFCKTVLRAWTLFFKVKRDLSNSGLWIETEPLFNKPLIPLQVLESRSIHNVTARAGCTIIADLKNGVNWKISEEMCNMTAIKSSRIIKRIMDGIVSALPSGFRQSPEENEVPEQRESFPPSRNFSSGGWGASGRTCSKFQDTCSKFQDSCAWWFWDRFKKGTIQYFCESVTLQHTQRL